MSTVKTTNPVNGRSTSACSAREERRTAPKGGGVAGLENARRCVCAHCGEHFNPRRGSQRFCALSCKRNHERTTRRKPAPRASSKVALPSPADARFAALLLALISNKLLTSKLAEELARVGAFLEALAAHEEERSEGRA